MASNAPETSSLESRVISREKIGEFVRFFFCLPSVLPIPDRKQIVDTIGNSPRRTEKDRATDPVVSVIVHQIALKGGRLSAMNEAVHRAYQRDADQVAKAGSTEGLAVDVNYTVIEAVTPQDSPDPAPATQEGHPAEWSSRSDPLTRCLRFADDLVRASRLATQIPSPRPLYPTIGNPVLMFKAPGERLILQHPDGSRTEIARPAAPWGTPSLLWLEQPHPLQDGTPVEPLLEDELEVKFFARMRSIREGDRSINWLERLVEAREALELRGESGQSVVLAVTSIEVLVANVLTMLSWEERLPVEDAATLWEDGKLLATITRRLAPKLKGSWSTKGGRLGAWYENAYRLRHRIVHGGYEPARTEAARALAATQDLATFVFDRIGAQRNTFPRTTLMTLSRSGLERRGLWGGRIKKFSEDVATVEDRWIPVLVKYGDDVLAVRLKTLA